MDIMLRILLLCVCVFTFWYVVRKIGKAQMQIEDAVFWILFMLFILALSLFPVIGTYFAALLGFESPANFVFLCVIFILLIKQFSMSVQISSMDSKIKELVQRLAIKELDRKGK